MNPGTAVPGFPGGRRGDHRTPALRITGLRFRYGEAGGGATENPGTAVPGFGWIVDVGSLEVARAEQVLLTGGSGRGKSTLLHLIAGLMDPVEGRIEVAGQDVHALGGAARDRFRGRHIGMIFQTFNLLAGFTAAENVMAALMFSAIPRREHRGRALALLEHLGIDRPGAEPEKMSVGQQQRVAAARAVACDPVLVLADEPTASLDPQNADTAMELIQRACREKGAALLCVSHDPTMAERFERRASLSALVG